MLIIEGETGSGKTTQIPQYLYESVSQEATATSLHLSLFNSSFLLHFLASSHINFLSSLLPLFPSPSTLLPLSSLCLTSSPFLLPHFLPPLCTSLPLSSSFCLTSSLPPPLHLTSSLCLTSSLPSASLPLSSSLFRAIPKMGRRLAVPNHAEWLQ